MLSEAINEVPYIEDPVEVGRGGFATVYRATDLQAGRPVAVKLLSLRSPEANLKYFDRERESLARLSTHPNVVTLHRTGVTTSGVPYLVMEFASGGSLSERLKAEGPIPWAEAVAWVLPVCGALRHAHEQGVRHRDVKPQNILISAHGEPLLSDFGIAGLAAGTETLTQKARLSLSYASPEQIDGRELDDSTDVYSLTTTLYTLISGAPAFADTTGAGLLKTAQRILHDRPAALDPSVPTDIRNAIAAGMAKNPANRPTIDELREALQQTRMLDAPPPSDELPEITKDFQPPQEKANDAILAAVVDDWSPTIPGPGETEDTAEPRQVPAATKRSNRSLSLAAIALLVVVGLMTAAWAGRNAIGGGDTTAEGSEAVASPSQSTVVNDETVDQAEPSGSAVIQAVPASPTTTGTTATTSQPTTAPPTTAADNDGDGIPNTEDNCPNVANRSQENRDDDAPGDVCDPDDDNDSVPDEADNCRFEANGGQADVDGDGLGDACDDFPDQDGDGIIDTNDSCIELPDDADSDGDGTPDKCDETPRGMVAIAASARIDRLTILNQAYGDGEADLFGDLTVAGKKFGLPEISDNRDVRPGNWLSDRVSIDPGSPLVRIRIWIRDEDDCLFCRDGLVDITPETGMNALQLVIDTQTGDVDLASDSWNRLQTIGTLTGPADGDLSGTITQVGENDGVHIASVDVTVTLVREPAP